MSGLTACLGNRRQEQPGEVPKRREDHEEFDQTNTLARVVVTRVSQHHGARTLLDAQHPWCHTEFSPKTADYALLNSTVELRSNAE
jgi:hypothetical protein